MIETLQSFPWPVQIFVAVLFSIVIVLAGIIVYVWFELEADDYWRKF